MKHETYEDALFPDECYAMQGAIFDVYKEIGRGLLMLTPASLAHFAVKER